MALGVIRLEIQDKHIVNEPMSKNLKRYYQAWELCQQGKKLREIAQIMGFKSGEWPRCMIAYIDFRLKSKFVPPPKELKKLALKYHLDIN